MIPSKNITALKTLHDKLPGIDWRLIGSSNLALQGVDIVAKDVDISIRVEDIQAVQSALQDYCIKQIKHGNNNRYSSFFGQFSIEGVQVDVMAGGVEKDGSTTGDVRAIEPKIIDVDGVSIPCVDLQAEYDAYISLGREEKAALIQLAINSNKL